MPHSDAVGTSIVAVVLAAGEARRFGSAKQAAVVDGRSLVQHAVDAAAGGGADEVIVVLGARAEVVASALTLPPSARMVVNPDFAAGQSTSLRAGVRAAGDAVAVVVLLADQPGVTAGDVRAVLDGHRATGAPLVRASYRGTPGHPVLLGRELFPEVIDATGDVGARDVLARHVEQVVEVAIDRDPPGDVDTPGDLAAAGGHTPPGP